MAATKNTQRLLIDARKELMGILRRLQHPYHTLERARGRSEAIRQMVDRLQLHCKDKLAGGKAELLQDCAYFALLGLDNRLPDGLAPGRAAMIAIEQLYGDAFKQGSRDYVERILTANPYFESPERDLGSPGKRRMLTVAQKVFLISEHHIFASGCKAFLEDRLNAYSACHEGGTHSVDAFFDEQLLLVDKYLHPLTFSMKHSWEQSYYCSLLDSLDAFVRNIHLVRDDIETRNLLADKMRKNESFSA